jgi:hypothetical protein
MSFSKAVTLFENYFLGKEHSEALLVNAIEERTKRKRFLYYTTVLSVMCLVALLVRLFFFEEVLLELSPLIIFYTMTLTILFSLKKYERYLLSSYILNFFAYVIIPIRVYQTGGIHSPAIFLFLTHITYNFLLFDKKHGYVNTAYGLINLGVFGFYIDASIPHYGNTYYMIMISIVSIVLIIPIILIFKEKDKVTEQLRRYEKYYSSLTIMQRLSHEINNPLCIALLNTDKVRRDHDIPALKVSLEALERINEIVKNMSSHENLPSLVDRLKQNPSETQIMRKL